MVRRRVAQPRRVSALRCKLHITALRGDGHEIVHDFQSKITQILARPIMKNQIWQGNGVTTAACSTVGGYGITGARSSGASAQAVQNHARRAATCPNLVPDWECHAAA